METTSILLLSNFKFKPLEEAIGAIATELHNRNYQTKIFQFIENEKIITLESSGEGKIVIKDPIEESFARDYEYDIIVLDPRGDTRECLSDFWKWFPTRRQKNRELLISLYGTNRLMDMGFLFVNYNTNYIINEILSFITGKENQDFAKKIRETRKAEKDYTAKLKLYMSIFSLEKEPEILCQCCDDDPTWITPDGEKGCTCDMLFNAQEELDNGKPVVLEFMCRRIYENGLRPVDLVMVFVPGQKIDREYIKNILKYEKFKIK